MMRISLIHGEDSANAYEKFTSLIDSSKSKGFEIIHITSPRNIVSQSLFEDKTVFILEKPNKVKLADWKWLGANAPKYNSNLLIFYDGVFPAASLRTFAKQTSNIEKFELPKILFAFLDTFSLKTFNDLVKIEPVELVLHLLARRLRDLYWVKVSPETLEMQDWQKRKLASQAAKFEIEKLEKIIKELAEIDIRAKTSDSDLKSMLDIFILKGLK